MKQDEIFNVDELKEIIIKSLDNYDKTNLKYRKYINSEFKYNQVTDTFGTFHLKDNDFAKASFQIIGYYDVMYNTWIWAWLTPIKGDLTELSKDLLNYGLKLDVKSISANQLYIKGLLLNSRYRIDERINLDINMAIFSYILNEKILFIYLKKKDNKIIYYAITEFIHD